MMSVEEHVPPILLRFGVAAVVGVMLLQLAIAAPAQQSEGVERGLETFDEVWRIIDETHFDPQFNGVDWQGARDELRPRAAAAETVAELRDVIRDMLGRLGQSHFALLPREAVHALGPLADERGGSGEPGFDTLLIDNLFVVSSVAAAGPAAAAGVHPGWVVRTVGDVDLDDRLAVILEQVDRREARLLAQRAADRFLGGRPGSEVEIGFWDVDDNEQLVTLERIAPKGVLTKFGNLPPLSALLESERLEPDVDVAVGLIAFNIWLPPIMPQFDQALDSLRDVDGIVVDLRGNPGGVGGMVMGIGGHFVKELVALGTMRTRQGELRFMANPRPVNPAGERVDPFAGPLAILMDGTSASTSEVFAGGLQAIGRARVFGETSMGATLPSMMDELPNGDVLQHAFADFVVAANGERLEGRGVIPDERISVTRAHLIEGRDPVMEAAIAWIVSQR